MAAIGYARSSGQVGVCIATSGPGATNLITGLADAMMDSVPVVAITGQVARDFIGTDAFQEIDVLGMSLSMSISVAELAIGFSMAVGVIFGLYPANKASKLKPIDALHYD